MPEYTVDWFDHHIKLWDELLGHLRGKQGKVGLELGCFEGRSAGWLLREIFTGRHSMLHCVDNFSGGEEHTGIDMYAVKRRCLANLKGFGGRVSILECETWQAWSRLPASFDFIYVDASHQAPDVIEDAVCGFRRLAPGGVMIFDDYLLGWPGGDRLHLPHDAIDVFLDLFQQRLVVLSKGYQVAVRKL